MTSYHPPAHLQVSVDLMVSYLVRPRPKLPFLALGEFGVGRGYAIDRVIEAHNLVPYWLTEPVEAPSCDMEGRPFFPVYDLDAPLSEVAPDSLSIPSVVLAPHDFYAKDDWKGAECAYFTRPASYEVEDFLVGRGYPRELANGNPTYGNALMAMVAWDAAGVHVGAEVIRPSGWDDFRRGGDAPVDDALFGYYAAENLPWEYHWWNTVLYLRSHVPGWLVERGLDEVRAKWPEKVRFPSILRVKKEERTPKVAVPVVSDLPPKPKTYDVGVDW